MEQLLESNAAVAGEEKGPSFWSNPAAWLREKNLSREFWVFFVAAFFVAFFVAMVSLLVTVHSAAHVQPLLQSDDRSSSDVGRTAALCLSAHIP